MKYKKHYWYILSLEDLKHPVVYSKGFTTQDLAKQARYKLLPKGKYSYMLGHRLREYPTIVMIPLPKLGIKILDDMNRVTGENARYARSFIKKCKGLLKLKGTQGRSHFLKAVTKVLNK